MPPIINILQTSECGSTSVVLAHFISLSPQPKLTCCIRDCLGSYDPNVVRYTNTMVDNSNRSWQWLKYVAQPFGICVGNWFYLDVGVTNLDSSSVERHKANPLSYLASWGRLMSRYGSQQTPKMEYWPSPIHVSEDMSTHVPWSFQPTAYSKRGCYQWSIQRLECSNREDILRQWPTYVYWGTLKATKN